VRGGHANSTTYLWLCSGLGESSILSRSKRYENLSEGNPKDTKTKTFGSKDTKTFWSV
jgi:hypothetical protein